MKLIPLNNDSSPNSVIFYQKTGFLRYCNANGFKSICIILKKELVPIAVEYDDTVPQCTFIFENNDSINLLLKNKNDSTKRYIFGCAHVNNRDFYRKTISTAQLVSKHIGCPFYLNDTTEFSSNLNNYADAPLRNTKKGIIGLFDIFRRKKPTLKEDIVTSKELIAMELNSSGYKVDFTIESLKEIDRFFEEEIDGLLTQNTGRRLFSIGCYIGEVIIAQYGGKWIADDSDRVGEINISIKLNNGSIIWPIQRVMKRYKERKENNIYPYAISLDD